MITPNGQNVLIVGLLLLTSIVLATTVNDAFLIVPVLYLFLSLPLSIQFKILTATALFPLGSRGLFGLPSLGFMELVAPLIMLGLMLRKTSPICKPRTKVTTIAWFGILCLLAALFVSYFRNPAGAKSLFGGIGVSYGLKQYYVALMCIATYFITYFVFRHKLVNVCSYLKYILIISIVIGILRVLTYLGFFRVPFFLGSLSYLELGVESQYFGMQSRRIGGMDLIAAFTLIPCIILNEAHKYKRLTAFGLALGVVFLIISGGRSSFIGIVAAMLVGIIRLGSKSFIKMLLAFAIGYFALSHVTMGSERTIVQNQYERIFMYESIAETQTYRYDGYGQLLSAFVENPVFGKGLSAVELEITAGIAEFGGHGTYVSLFGLFGLAGIAFLLLFVLSPVITGLERIIRISYIQALPKDIFYSIKFSTLTMIWMLFLFGAGGDGYSTAYLYLFIGVLTAQLDNAKLFMTRPMGDKSQLFCEIA
jgi:hypothetical protein